MIYNILTYSLVTILFLAGTFAMVVLDRGGTVSVVPIKGVGLIYQRTKIWMPTKEDSGFWVKGVSIGILFLFIVYQWEEGADNTDSPNNDDITTHFYGY